MNELQIYRESMTGNPVNALPMRAKQDAVARGWYVLERSLVHAIAGPWSKF